MDAAALATATLGVLTPYVVKGVEGFISSAGKDAYEKCKSLLILLRGRLSKDPEASEQLARFEEKPARYRPVLESILTEKLANDSAFGHEIRELLAGMGPSLEIIQKMKEGEDVTGLEVEQLERGTVRIEQEIEKGKAIKGGRFGKLG
jgi:hypothetical protein